MRTVKIALTALALILPACAQAAPAPVTAEAHAFQIGAFKAWSLRDLTNVVPNDNSVIGQDQTPEAVAAVLKAAGQPTDHITLSIDALLVKAGDHLVLIDTGMGPKAHGVLMESLAKAGVAPDQITDVLITHSHPDHIGGLLTADGTPAFPKAVVRMTDAEWASLQANPQQAAFVTAITPQIQAFAGGTEVLPGITSVVLKGHTPGHTGYEIASGTAKLLDIGDMAHSSVVSLAKPEWAMGYDSDKPTGEATRREELTVLAKSGETIFAPHFPFPGTGKIVTKGDGFALKPTK
ncbi:MAG: MBL fold metallo-hydrolase [Asticcacaulis sp.]|uniref:MBL fold metallo-hydrolase n=1 Tax=Asticcacaulis sp. TaxID=1872648 RepID=UPI0039E30D0C